MRKPARVSNPPSESPSTPVSAIDESTTAARPGWLLPAVLALVVIAFGRIVFNEFAGFDDPATIYGNERLNPPTLTGLVWHWAHPHLNIYIPLTFTLWSTLASVAYLSTPDEQGIYLNPFVFHAASLLVHVANTGLVFHLLRRIIGGRAIGAAVGALLFGLHPLQVESVAWTSGMKDVLYTFFSLLALLGYVDHANADGAASRRSYWLATTGLVLGMLSKPTAMVVPILAGAIDLLLLRRSLRQVWASLWPWFLLSTICAVVARLVQPASMVPTAPLWARPFVAMDAIAFYLWKLVAPWGLAIDYGRTPMRAMESGWFWVGVSITLTVALAVVLLGRRRPWLIAGAIIALVPILPTSGLVPFEFQGYSTVADHYVYLPMLGVALVLAAIVSRHSNRLVVGVCSVGAVVLGLLSFVQAGTWKNEEAVWRRTVQVNPNSWTGYKNLAVIARQRGDLQTAEDHLNRSIAAHPQIVASRAELAILLTSQRRHSEAIEQLQTILELARTVPYMRNMPLAGTYAQIGLNQLALKQPEAAILAFERALIEQPGHAVAQEGLVDARVALAVP
ncbi:MAG TPA: tetratricopeptide repeat protein [Tepidisphaeraceae bacterium]|nr:tetratricopeptide repeat protein [Tepidisphaeraceae bacterium]